MAKLSLCGILWLCCLFVLFSGSALSDSESDQLENSNSSPNPNPSEDSKCSFKCEDFKALENDNQQLKISHAEIIEQLKSLSKQFEEFKKEISSEDHGLSLLKAPVRGPPGKPGKDGQHGKAGAKGDKGDRGSTGPQGERGQKGERGQVGPPGQIGSKEDRGSTGPRGQRGERGEKGTTDPRSIKSCNDAMDIFPSPRSTKQTTFPHGNSRGVEILCDFETDGGGWTIIQKRSSGPKQEFKQNWNAYVSGFGSLDGNFWIGLENIHALTQNGDQELRIELEDFEGEKRFAKYSNFSISDASDFYRLTLTGFSGDSTSQNSFYANGMKFSTIDKDNDNHPSRNCAVRYGGGGWWFDDCGNSNLNGLYFEKGEYVPEQQGIYWISWNYSYYYSLAKTEMKIRPRKP